MIESLVYRQSANKGQVERTVDERVLLFDVRLHSVMEYTEKPFDRVEFTQLTGDLRAFRANWDIVPNQQGSRFRFKGFLEPDTLVPLFIVAYFIKNGLIDKLNTLVRMAEKRKHMPQSNCANLQQTDLKKTYQAVLESR